MSRTFPVPPLEATLRLLKEYCSPLPSYNETTFDQAVATFLESGKGPLLQAKLVEHAKNHVNWLEPFWYDMYLCNRDPLPINYNYTFTLNDVPKSNVLQRAAHCVTACEAFRRLIASNTLTPDMERNKEVLCMDQYKRLFGCCRIPKPKRDLLRVVGAGGSNHIVVMRKGYMFVVEFNTPVNGAAPSVADVHETLFGIVEFTDHMPPNPRPLGYFTSGNRDLWADAYKALLCGSLDNESALDVITSAQYVLCLDTREEEDDENNNYRSRMESSLHGRGSGNRWYDSSFTIIVSERNNTVSLNMEHAWGDGHTVARLCSYIHNFKEGESVAAKSTSPQFRPITLAWSTTSTQHLYDTLRQEFRDLCSSCLLDVIETPGMGSKHIQKEVGVSPDAFLQVAFQLAAYRTYGALRSTYESAMIKVFHHGRTEAMRSVTMEMKRFVEKGGAPLDAKLFQAACTAHGKRLEQCKQGNGIQRHIMGLRNMRDNNPSAPIIDVPVVRDELFTDFLSTSCVIADGIKAFAFGPVCKHGLGLGYTRTATSVCVVVTGWREDATQFQTFLAELRRALQELSQLSVKENRSSKL